MMIIDVAAQAVERDGGLAAVSHQPGFVQIVVTLEIGDGLLDRGIAPAERQILRDEAPHFRFQAFQFIGRERRPLAHLAVVTPGGEGMIDKQRRFGKQIGKGRLEEKRQRPAVDARAVGVRHRHRLDARFDADEIGQLMQFTVDHGADEGRWQVGGDGLEQTSRTGSARALQRATVGQVNFD